MRIAGCGTEVQGVFSTLRGKLSLHTRDGTFEGACRSVSVSADCTALCIEGPEDL